MSIAARGLAAIVRGYQRWISPLMGPRCRYYPTCSHYAVDALSTHGAFKGSVLSAWRILRCNPWSDGGVNHVPPRGKWRSPAWIPPEDWAGHDLPDRPQRKRLWKNKFLEPTFAEQSTAEDNE